MSSPTLLGVQLGINGYGPFGHQPENDIFAVLDVVRATGYDGAEIMTNVLGRGIATVQGAFAATGLHVAALHVFAEEIDDDSEVHRFVDIMDQIQCPRLIVTSGVQDDVAFYQGLAERLHKTGSYCASRGKTLYYHPHDAEYRRPPELGGQRGVDLLWRFSDPAYVRFNIDTYWAYRGGADARAVIAEFAPRCDYYHAKDGKPDGTYPLGQGEVDIGGCLETIRQSPPTAWVVYEDANPRRRPEELCEIAMACLRQYGFGR